MIAVGDSRFAGPLGFSSRRKSQSVLQKRTKEHEESHDDLVRFVLFVIFCSI
jgi:hypothetical protein